MSPSLLLLSILLLVGSCHGQPTGQQQEQVVPTASININGAAASIDTGEQASKQELFLPSLQAAHDAYQLRPMENLNQMADSPPPPPPPPSQSASQAPFRPQQQQQQQPPPMQVAADSGVQQQQQQQQQRPPELIVQQQQQPAPRAQPIPVPPYQQQQQQQPPPPPPTQPAPSHLVPQQVISLSPQPVQQPQPIPQQQQPPPQQPQRQQQPSSFQQQQQQQPSYHYHSGSPLYIGHNPFIEILRPHSYADDNIVTLNLSHSHIYEIDSEAFVGQRFEHIDLSNNKLGLVHSRSFRIGPNHSRHNQYDSNGTLTASGKSLQRRPPPAHPKSLTIDFSHNPAIVALSGAFDHIDVPNCLLNFTNSTVELKFGAFKKYFKEHPGHLVDVESVDCCEQEWLLGYKHNFVARTHCDHEPSLYLSRASQQAIIESCIAYVKSGRRSMTIQGPSLIHQVGDGRAGQKGGQARSNCEDLTYVILGGTAMILTSLSIYIIFYMFSLKAAFVYQMQRKS